MFTKHELEQIRERLSYDREDEFLWALANRIDAARKAADSLSPYITQGATA